MPYKTYQQPATKRPTRGSTAATAVSDPQATLNDVKCEDAEMKDVSNIPEENDTETENEVEKKKPWLQRTKEGGVKKIPKDVQKRRRNYRLKKILTPKAPIMVLHELLGQNSVNYEILEPTHVPMKSMPQLYTAKAVYDDQTFVGMGPSKSIAKNVCAEHVLQYITTQTCLKKPDHQDQENGNPNNKRMESETPWVSLASLALFKLFNDWQAQGYELPADLVKGGNAAEKVNQVDQNPAGGAANKTKKAVVKTEKPLPENPTEKHPVQLLNEMNGPLVYEQTGQSGSPPNCVFTLTVTVNDVPYSGQGKSKKEAKKSAAQSALASLYNVEYSAQV